MITLVDKQEEVKPDWTIYDIATKRCPRGWEIVFEECIDDLMRISEMYEGEVFYPLKENLFRAFELCPLSEVKVVIIGQDPYPQLMDRSNIPRAQGLSFSVDERDSIPSSLMNIFKELKSNFVDYQMPSHGDLTLWALQGVLLLNSCLTVKPGCPSDKDNRWCPFIETVFKFINQERPGTIYLLWGGKAQKLRSSLGSNSKILTAAHPSGLSANRGFFGCEHFKKVNRILELNGDEPINWQT